MMTTTASRLVLATLGLGGLAATTAFGPPAKPTPPQQGVGITLANIDTSVSPCDDFYHYANGNWLKSNPVPAAETRWGAFNELQDRNISVEKRILVKAAADHSAKPGTNAQKVGDFYAAAMDSAAIEAAGLKYLQPKLTEINNLKSLADIQKTFSPGWYGFGVGQDSKNSTVYAVQLRQGGLGLGDRDYYLKDDSRSKTIRAAYKTYMTTVFQLLGDAPSLAATNADAVITLETKLAQASRGRVDLRDRIKNYNKVPVAQATKDYPNLNLPLRLKEAGLS
jgi:putative endopeptidase